MFIKIEKNNERVKLFLLFFNNKFKIIKKIDVNILKVNFDI